MEASVALLELNEVAEVLVEVAGMHVWMQDEENLAVYAQQWAGNCVG